MILLFNDFGPAGPYLGQMEAVLRREAPEVPVIHLLSNAPMGDPRRSGYLLAALAPEFPEGSVFLAVVDPGVGGERRPVALLADGRWFIGPDNGLFNTVAVLAEKSEWHWIGWQPDRLSASFHGRDLFAPTAARIASGGFGDGLCPLPTPELSSWPSDLPEVIYIDHYGNAVTGNRFRADMEGRELWVNGRALAPGRTFSSVPEGAGFWYCNSIGLVEIAVNLGRADVELCLRIGVPIAFK